MYLWIFSLFFMVVIYYLYCIDIFEERSQNQIDKFVLFVKVYRLGMLQNYYVDYM